MAGWEELQRKVAECRLCGLHEGRTQTVFGVGDVNADWMLIGEAPGAEEDRGAESPLSAGPASCWMPCCRRPDSRGSRCSSPTS